MLLIMGEIQLITNRKRKAQSKRKYQRIESQVLALNAS